MTKQATNLIQLTIVIGVVVVLFYVGFLKTQACEDFYIAHDDWAAASDCVTRYD